MSNITDRLHGVRSSQAIKVPCLVATTANITLSGEQTIDGVAVTAAVAPTPATRVLVKDQTTAAENGIWEVNSSAWRRAPDWDGIGDVVTGTQVYANSGTQAGRYVVTTTGTITIGTTSVVIESDAAADTFLQDGASAVSRTVQDKLTDSVSVKDFGALGTDTVDETSYFAAAFASGAPDIYVPDGAYLLGDLQIPNTVRRIYGPGTLKYTGANTFNSMMYTEDYAGEGLVIGGHGLTVDVSPVTYSAVVCIGVFGTSNSVVCRDVKFKNCGRFGMYLAGDDLQVDCGAEFCTFDNYAQSGFYSDEDEWANYNRCFLRFNKFFGPSPNYHNAILAGSRLEAIGNYVYGGHITSFGMAFGMSRGGRILNNEFEDCVGDNFDVMAINGAVGIDWICSGNVSNANTGVSQEIGMAMVAYPGSVLGKGLFATNSVNDCGFSAFPICDVLGGDGVVLDIGMHGNIARQPNREDHIVSNSGIYVFTSGASGINARTSISGGSLGSTDSLMKYGVLETADCLATRVQAPIIYGAGTANMLIQGTGSKYFEPTYLP